MKGSGYKKVVNMKVLDILYVRYFKEDGSILSIGGVESYITQLGKLAVSLGIKVRVFQYGTHDFHKQADGIDVYAYFKKGKHNGDFLLKKAMEFHQAGDKVLTIIANDTLIPKQKIINSIVIQHGIGFDSCFGKKEPLFMNFCKHSISAFSIISRLQNVDKVVCVDNNFISWYRTQTSFRDVKLIPIMNFAEIGPSESKPINDKVKIVFARRFVQIRGTRLFAPVAKKLLAKYNNIEITFAGGGPDEQFLKDCIGENSRVRYCSYQSDESINFHRQFDIAVVPTIYSEGTSLSLLEAMSAQCAVVCTNVGGMTNIILDEYNGLMITPCEKELYEALCLLIEDSLLREKLSRNAYETVKASFSLEKWQKEWIKVLNEYFC